MKTQEIDYTAGTCEPDLADLLAALTYTYLLVSVLLLSF